MDSVDMHNALVSLCLKRSDGGDALYQLGYRSADARLEYPLAVPGGKRVVVDLLLVSSVSNSVVCCESKAGRNIDVGQGRNYQRLKPDQFAPLISAWRQARAFSVDVCYLCATDSVERIRKGLVQANLDHSIIGCDELADGQVEAAVAQYPHLSTALTSATRPGLITLERNKLKNAKLGSLLGKGIAFDWAAVSRFCRFDLSTPTPRITSAILDALIAFAHADRTRFSSEQIAAHAYGESAWAQTVRKTDLINVVNDALISLAADLRLRPYLTTTAARPSQMSEWQLWPDPAFVATAQGMSAIMIVSSLSFFSVR